MTAGASLLDLIGERTEAERAPAVRAFAKAFLRRLAADGSVGELPPEALLREIIGAFDFASARGAEPIAVRAFTPTLEEHGYEAPGSVVETNTEDWPFLVDSVSAALRERGLGHPARAAPDRRRRARRRRGDRGGPAPARGLAARVGHALRPRPAGARRAARGARGGAAQGALRRPRARSRTSRRWPTARGGWSSSRAPARRATPTRRSTRPSPSSSGCCRTTSSSSATASTASATARSRSCPARGSGSSPVRRRRPTRKPVPVESLSPGVRERALEGDLLIVSKTNRLARVHRRVRMDYVGVRRISAEGEIVGEARMLGLFTTKAYAEPASQTPLLHRKLRQILRSEDLIEGSHDYKAAVSLFDSFPKDELFAASTDDLRGAVVALLALQGEQVRLLGRRDADAPQRVADRRAAARPLRRRPAASGCSSCSARRFDDRRGRLPPRARRGRPRRRCTSRVHASERPARRRLPRARARGRRGHAHLGRRAARAPGRAPRRDARPRAGGRVGAALPALLQGLDHAGARGRTTSAASSACETLGEPFVVGLQNERDETGERTRVGALQDAAARSSCPTAMPMLEDLGLRVIEEVPTRLHGGDGETWVQDFGVLGPGERAARPRRRSASASPTASRPSGAARPSRTRSTGSWSAPG